MKCTAHQNEAVGICAYCGRAVCSECAKTSAPARLACSENCAAALARDGAALQMLVEKNRQGARVNAIFYLLCGVLSAAGAVGAYYYLPSPFLIWFCAGCSFVFIASGIWQILLARTAK